MKKKILSDTKFHQLAQLLAPKEWRNFGKWMHSPWCNSNKKLAQLYDLLKDQHPLFASKKMNKETLFGQLYPQHAYDPKWMRNLLSDLSKQIERFLAFEQLDEQEGLQNQMLQEVFLQRGRKDWFFKKAQQQSKAIKEKTVKDWEDHLALALLYERMYRNIDSSDRQKTEVNYFYESNEALEQFYALGKIRFWVEQQERQEIIQQAEETPRAVQLQELNGPPEFDFYQHFLAKEKVPEQLKKMFLEQLSRFNKKDQSIMLFLLINEEVRGQLKNKEDAFSKMFELYKIGLKEGLLIHQGRMTSSTFANIVTIGNRLKAYDFVQGFLDTAISLLEPHLQEDGRDWAKAHLFYNQGKNNLPELELKLSQRKQDNTIFSIRTKALLLQLRFDAFLEKKEVDDFLWNFSLAFEKQLNRDKNFSTARLSAIKKFVQFTRRLYKFETGATKQLADLQKINDDIQATHPLRARQWLLNKITFLQKKL